MFSIPNLLTAGRIVLTPWIGWALARSDYKVAFWLLLIAGLSDGIDGFIARRFHQQSKLGAYLDPIADKLLLTTVYAGLGWSGAAPVWLVWLVIGRDVLILSFAMCALLLTRLRDFPPSVWGKISTFFQLTYAGAAILSGLTAWPWTRALAAVLLSGTAAATAWSGFDYLLIAYRRLRAASTGP